MRVLAFASQKSGAGKTTLAGHVAVQAQRSGTKSVVLVDADPDGSLADWFSLREEDELQVEQAVGKDLLAKLKELQTDGVDLVVIDTPPSMNHSIDDSILAADLVAIPARPWAHDLDAAGATVELIQSHGKPFVFVVNGTAPEEELSHDVVMSLAQHGTVASVSIPRSLAVLESMLAGQTVMDLPDAPAPASHVARLWEYLSKRLEKSGGSGIEAAVSRAAAREQAAPAAEPKPASAAPFAEKPERAPTASTGPEPQARPVTAAPSGNMPTADDVANPEALRRYPRFRYDQPAILVINDKSIDCIVHDISAGGALVLAKGDFKVADRVTLSLDSIGKLQAEVRHQYGLVAGQFAATFATRGCVILDGDDAVTGLALHASGVPRIFERTMHESNDVLFRAAVLA